MNSLHWHIRGRVLDLSTRPLVMGIVNVTPDSFSDGGCFVEPATAIDHGLRLVAEGADIIDVGGESTRPSATPVTLEEELQRIVPVVVGLVQRTDVPISIDTMKAAVARECLCAGAAIVNDVSGFRDPAMVKTAAEYRAGVIVMHMPGTPQTMHLDPHYDDVVREVGDFFESRLRELIAGGIPADAVCLDPGIGFGKNLEHSLQLLAHLGEYARFGRPICLGVSRKGFIGAICNRRRHERLAGSLAVACIAAARRHAHVLRVHDVAPTRDAALLLDAIDRAGNSPHSDNPAT